jgi:excisionase family DNA binding protein
MRFLPRETLVRTSATPTHTGLIETLEFRDSALVVPEVAALLRITPGTVYRLAKKHVIPGSFRAGGTVLFNPQKLAQWMRGGAR